MASSGMAMLRANTSTLNIDDMNDLLSSAFSVHSQIHTTFLDAMAEIALEIVDVLRVELGPSFEWVIYMDSAVSSMLFLVGIFKNDSLSELEIRALTTFLAASFAANSVTTLDAMRRKSADLLNAHSTPFVISASRKVLFASYMSAVFQFWVSYDQMIVSETSREKAKEIMNSTIENSKGVNRAFLIWMGFITLNKFDQSVRTIQTAESLMIIENDGTSEQKIDIFHFEELN